MITLIAKFLSALNSETRPSQIAMAIALALLIGFNGVVSLIGLLVIILLFVLRVNLSIFLALSAVFTVLSFVLSPLSNMLGESLLTSASLTEFWTSLYQTYWFRLETLNNTLNMGNLVLSILLFLPTYFFSHWLIVKYRHSMMDYVNKFKVVQTLKASKFYRMYLTVNGQ